MSQVRLAAGFERYEVQFASNMSPTEYRRLFGIITISGLFSG